MYLPKTEIFNLLSELDCEVSQTKPPIFNTLPYITFTVTGNDINTFLDNSIAYQDITVQIDIWADDSPSASNLLSQVEEKMRNNFYSMIYSSDVPNVGNVFHIVSRFTKKV